MKKNRIIIIFIFMILLCGCEQNKNVDSNKVTSDGSIVNTTQMKHKKCSRQGSAGAGAEVSLNYDLYYTGENINILHSEEKVITASNETLDTYEEAYRNIHKNYEGLQYYDAKVERGDTTVTSDITINYDKINIKDLLRIEGEEDNIIVGDKAKLSKWLELAKKFGTTCEDVE